ncbi:hypothetical protein MUK42_11936 [Musa troglodytarum]|uniref:Peptidase M50B-like protein n=1 Tax=Musa troglodytarum TaxID=320322 RepID=A0A9E7GL38_9LILI|nr:hypothetical protein MUK42_11936 [Musa troglodytarum]
MPNWELKHCCDHDQSVFIVTIAVFTVVILALWRTVLLTPFKLITVFLHETSHALACKLTCGDLLMLHLIILVNLTEPSEVEGIQVHANEGGVTQTRGGIYWIILPAGYLGSSFWGMVFILASTNLLTTRIAAGCFLLALLVVLFVAKNWLLRGLCIGFIIFLAIVWLLQETTKVRILRFVILFIGVMNSLFSVYEFTRVMPRNLLKFVLALVMVLHGELFGVSYHLHSFVDPFTLVLLFSLKAFKANPFASPCVGYQESIIAKIRLKLQKKNVEG